MSKRLQDRLPVALTLEIKDPATNEIETTLKVVGNESRYFKDLLMARYRAEKVLEDINTANKADIIDQSIWFAAAHIVEWDEEYFGKPFSVEAACDVLSEPAATFIVQQITEFVAKRDGFFPKASVEPANA